MWDRVTLILQTAVVFITGPERVQRVMGKWKKQKGRGEKGRVKKGRKKGRKEEKKEKRDERMEEGRGRERKDRTDPLVPVG